VKESRLRLYGVFLISSNLIAYELAVMRIFAVSSWSNFGSMVISIALLGFGFAGTLLTFLYKRIMAAAHRWLGNLAVVIPLAMALSQTVAQLIPFNPIFIVSDPLQILWVGVFYLVYSFPFFLGAVFIGVAFIAMGSMIHRMYFWNMIGSGLGGIVVLLCMYWLPPDKLIIPMIILGFFASLLCYVRSGPGNNSLWIDPGHLALSSLAFLGSLVLILFSGEVRVSDYKPISYARKYPDSSLAYYSYGPTGEMHVYSSSFFHFAPGLSDNANLELKRMPEQAFLGLYIDGGGPIGVMRRLEGNEEAYMDYLPMSASYLLVHRPKVLLVKLGGGTSLFNALYHKARSVQVVEPNPAIVRLLDGTPEISRFNGDLLQDPRVNLKTGESRAFCATTSQQFDLVEVSLIDSIGLSEDAGYTVDENYTYTVEAIRDYMRCLNQGGMLSITVWNKMTPPRNVPKLLATVVRSLHEQGISDPGKHIFVFNLLFSSATVLVKKTPFKKNELNKLQEFCTRMSFDVCYFPGISPRSKDFELILKAYSDMFAKNPSAKIPVLPGAVPQPLDSLVPELLPGDLYHFSLLWMLSDRGNDLMDRYVFDIRPARDDRPYYSAYLKLSNLGAFMDHLVEISDEWGYLLLLATLLQSLVFGALIILVPVAGRWRELFVRKRGTWGVVVYYSCLGMGYMAVEIYLIQKLVFFLAEPIVSVTLVITAMLIVSAIGSLFSQRFKEKRTFGVRLAVGGLALTILFYILALPGLMERFLGMPLAAKGAMAVLFVAPAAFCMGMPFPTGLSALTETRRGLLPWAWGLNGALSVTGAVLARLVSISFGFSAVLAGALCLYLLAGLVFPANEAGKKRASRVPAGG